MSSPKSSTASRLPSLEQTTVDAHPGPAGYLPGCRGECANAGEWGVSPRQASVGETTPRVGDLLRHLAAHRQHRSRRDPRSRTRLRESIALGLRYRSQANKRSRTSGVGRGTHGHDAGSVCRHQEAGVAPCMASLRGRAPQPAYGRRWRGQLRLDCQQRRPHSTQFLAVSEITTYRHSATEKAAYLGVTIGACSSAWTRPPGMP